MESLHLVFWHCKHVDDLICKVTPSPCSLHVTIWALRACGGNHTAPGQAHGAPRGAQVLQAGAVVSKNLAAATVRSGTTVVVPQGMSAEEIAEKLQSEGLRCDSGLASTCGN